MKKTIIFALALALLGGAAYANFAARDTVPAATLLVPYIIVDTDSAGTPNPAGYTTLTVVTNVSSSKEIIHVSVFNAASEAVIDFDEVLSGYDVWSINWKDLVTGDFENFDTGSPSTGFWSGTIENPNPPQSWGPTMNNKPSFNGLLPAQDTDYTVPPNTGCGFPWGNQTIYHGLIVSGLQSPLVAWPNQDTNCVPSDGAEIKNWPGWLSTLGDTPLFFYATIDVVRHCNSHFPDDAQYWNGDVNSPGQYPTEANVITGYDFYLNFASNLSESLPTVNIEAWGGWDSIGFYSANKVNAGLSPVQDREPLPTAWQFNFFTGPVSTFVNVWKNYDDFETLYVAACRPYIYYAFDENENSKSSTTPNCPSGTFCLQPEPNVFPFQTQRVPVNPTNFDGLLTGNGWMLLIFDPSIPYRDGVDLYLQSYVFAQYVYGAYSTAVEATTMSNVWAFPGQTLPNLDTYDGAFLVYPAAPTP